MGTPIPDGGIARLRARWIDWHVRRRPREAFTQDQIAAWVQEAWTLPPAYRLTRPGDPTTAALTLHEAARVYHADRRGWLATAQRATAKAPRLFFQLTQLRKSA
jgi:hypothetical protein